MLHASCDVFFVYYYFVKTAKEYLSTTERYLGKISDVEAMKWIDNLYA